MEKIQVSCPGCGATMQTSAEMAGRTGKCKSCGASITVPMPDEALPELADAEPVVEASEPAPRAPRSARRRTASARRGRGARTSPEAQPTQNIPLALGAAALGALVGAGVWAGVAIASGYELGWLAWGVGLAVGGAAVFVGARGQAMAMACAGLAVVGILSGKLVTVNYFLDKALRSQLTAEIFDKVKWSAEAYARIDPADDKAVREYMSLYEHTNAPDSDSISPQELARFRKEVAPQLAEIGNFSFEQWQNWLVDNVHISTFEKIKESLDPKDILFFILSVATAYGVVIGASRRDYEAAIARRRAEREAESE